MNVKTFQKEMAAHREKQPCGMMFLPESLDINK